MSSSDSSYHLTKSEISVVKDLICVTNRGSRYAIRCSITYDQKHHYRSAVIALCEYALCFLVHCKNRLKIKKRVHLYDIKKISAKDHYTLEIAFGCHLVVASSLGFDNFTHMLLQIFSYSTNIMNRDTMKFKPYSLEQFPQFNPYCSIPQYLQICYDAYCSYYQSSYFHEIAQYFHQIVLSENAIFDLNLLPYPMLDLDMEYGFDFIPFFSTASHFKFFKGIVCSDAYVPNLLTCVCRMLKNSDNIRFLKLSNLGITTGGEDFAYLIKQNKKLDLVSIDLSGNKIIDLENFTRALSCITKPLYYLNLANCDMSFKATEYLITSLMSNIKLSYLTYLDITGAKMTRSSAIYFSNFFHLRQNNIRILKMGEITNGFSELFKELTSEIDQSFPLCSLCLVGSKLDKSYISNLKQYIAGSKYLQELDISGTEVTASQVAQIITEINHNCEINKFSLHLNNLNLNRTNLSTVREAFAVSQLRKWVSLSLENNGMTSNDFHHLLSIFNRMVSLRTLNIGGNFDYSSKGIETYLPNLLTLASLEKLSLQGNKEHCIPIDRLKPFFKSLENLNNHPIRLNLMDNNLGTEGYKYLANLVSLDKLTELEIDGNKPDAITDIFDLFELIGQSKKLYLFSFPFRDVHRIMDGKLKPKRREYFQKLNFLKRDYTFGLQKKLTNSGVHSIHVLNGIKQIEEIVEAGTVELHKFLDNKRVTVHSLCSKIFDLPLPFQEFNKSPDSGVEIKKIQDPEINKLFKLYDAPTEIVKEDRKMDTRGMFYHSFELLTPSSNPLKDENGRQNEAEQILRTCEIKNRLKNLIFNENDIPIETFQVKSASYSSSSCSVPQASITEEVTTSVSETPESV